MLSLRLSGNKIERRGAAHLASVLQVNSTLRELELADCDLVNTHTRARTHMYTHVQRLPSDLFPHRTLRA